jgi:hypothetical protein
MVENAPEVFFRSDDSCPLRDFDIRDFGLRSFVGGETPEVKLLE